MAVISLTEETVLYIYKCPVCGGYFSAQTGSVKIRCAVLHSPGSCCHYAERRLTLEQVQRVTEIAKEANPVQRGD